MEKEKFFEVAKIMMKKISETLLCLVAFVAAAFIFVWFDVEGLLLGREHTEPVSAQEIEVDTTADYAGLPGGEGVEELTGIGQWDGLLPELDYVTVTPRAVYETDVYTLAKWESFFSKKANGMTGRRRSEVVKGWLHMPLAYSRVYVIELPDKSHVLAQMNCCFARRIQKGEALTLPLGTRRGMLDETRALLEDDLAQYGAPDDYVLYTMNDAWQKEHADIAFYGKLVVAIVVGFVLGVILLLIADVFGRKRSFEYVSSISENLK